MISSRPNLLPVVLAAVLAVAFALGGGGSRFGLANLVVQLTALAALAAYAPPAWRFWKEAPPVLTALVAASVLLPLAQLVPLPESLWSGLPRRDLVSASLDLAEIESTVPISLFPLRTALAATALITPLAILSLGWSIPRHHLFNLGWLIVAMGVVTVLLGAVQISGGGGRFQFWDEGFSIDVLLGTFANRNTTGLFLVGALSFALMLPFPKPAQPVVLLAGRAVLAALIVAAIILTRSRTALVLAAIPLSLGLLHVALAARPNPQGRSSIPGILIVLGILALGFAGLGAAVVSAPGRLAETLERFEATSDDARQFIWEDATYAAGRYWPVGAGIGTFDEVFQVDEAVENVSVRRAGRAHNDYIEIAVEAGAFGLGLVGLWLIALAWLAWRARRSHDRWAAWAASSFLLAIALQSVTDYPLRTQTMLAMAAFALVVLVRIASEKREMRA